MLSTNQKGAIAETAIAHAAIKLGIEVYKPVAEGGRFDLIFAIGPKLIRVQCSGRCAAATSSWCRAIRLAEVGTG